MPKSRHKQSKPAPAGRTSLPEIETPYAILRAVRSGEISERDLRNEYTRLRDRAQKQLKRLMGSEYKVPKRWRNIEEREAFWKLSELRDVREIAYALNDLQEFINSDITNVSSRRRIDKKIVDTLREHGYTGINTKNVGDFGDFMEAMRLRYGGRKSYPSGDLAQFFSDNKGRSQSIPVNDNELMGAFLQWQAMNAV